MTIREINKLTRDGGKGLNVYLTSTLSGWKQRITRAKMVKGSFQVRTISGNWLPVISSDTLTAEW